MPCRRCDYVGTFRLGRGGSDTYLGWVRDEHQNHPRVSSGRGSAGRSPAPWVVSAVNRHFVVELKTGKFQPEYTGKLNFYIALVDDRLRREAHADTVGILSCGTKNDRSVRYSLGRSTSPMAVAAYTYDKLPPAEQRTLPDEDHLTAALEWAANAQAAEAEAISKAEDR